MAFLFGSRAHGSAHPGSDTDLAFWFEDGSALERLDRLAALEPELRRLAGGPVDLVSLQDAGPALAYEAVIRGRVLYRVSLEELFRLEQQVRSRYEDLVASQRFFTAARRARMGLTG